MSEKVVVIEAGDDFAAAAKVLASPSWPPTCEICHKKPGGHMVHRDGFGFFRYSITLFHCDDCKEQSKSHVRMLCSKRAEEKREEAIAQLRSGDENYLKYFQVKLHNNIQAYTEEDKTMPLDMQRTNWLLDWLHEKLPDMADKILNFNCEVCQKHARSPILSWNDEKYHIYCFQCCPPNASQVIF